MNARRYVHVLGSADASPLDAARGAARRAAGAIRTIRERLRGIGSEETRPPPPRSFVDAEGREIELRAYGGDERAFEALMAMYADFDPAQRAQGTPPIGEDAVREWLEGTMLEGPSVVAWHGDRAVGHVAFVPDGEGRHEFAIFVHQDHQRAGVGTELALSGFAHARERSVEHVWLTVEPWKRGIQKFYSDLGFETVNPFGPVHRMSRYL